MGYYLLLFYNYVKIVVIVKLEVFILIRIFRVRLKYIEIGIYKNKL